MIQVKRGSTQKWSGVTLAPGQPGYDRTKNKIKIGDGETTWSELPYTSGLHAEEILYSEEDLASLTDEEKAKFTTNIITYGTKTPDNSTVGQIYLQQCDGLDYVVEYGTTDTGWTYQKWKSGIAKCWCNYLFETTVEYPLEFFYQSTTINTIPEYPFAFTDAPTETATIQSAGGQVLLASSSKNTNTKPGSYAIIYLVSDTDSVGGLSNARYRISIQVEGFWRTIDGNEN